MTQPVAIDAIIDALADALAERIAARIAARPQPAGKLLSIKQAADHVGRSPAAVRHLVNSGQIPARVVKRMGKRVFLVTAELDRWIDAQ